MKPPTTRRFGQRPPAAAAPGGPLAAQLLSVVDGGLVAIVCAAPFVFGGRHDLGRLVFVSLVAVTSVAWFVRQSLVPDARWTKTAANGLILFAIALVALQLVPLPADWLARISPRTAELLPLWTAGHSAVQLGTWSTISLTPHQTALSLAMLISYGLLFVVLTGRIESVEDVEWLMNVVAVSAVLMASFGLLQLFTSNGQFFWCYVHPYRTTDYHALGSFMNRNHFASFLVLGVGPLVRWLVAVLRDQAEVTHHRRQASGAAAWLPAAILGASLTIVLLGIFLSFSRGGTIALVIATLVIGIAYWRWQLIDEKYLLGLAGIGIVMLGLLSIYGYEPLSNRMSDLSSGSLEALDRNEGRRKIWAANLAAFEHGWMTGSGAGSHREINPVYLKESSSHEYTHAENGYLQVATEMGAGGVALLVIAFGLCGTWSVTCWSQLARPQNQLCFGAAAAGLAASAAHSTVDFVWYIPACMSVTIVSAAVLLRLAQFGNEPVDTLAYRRQLSKPTWWECIALVVPVAAWAVYVFIGPGIAAIHWDRYLRAQIANQAMSRDKWASKISGKSTPEETVQIVLNDSMLEHLQKTLTWDPEHSRAHFELSQRYLDLFEMKQRDAANAMGVLQISDATRASRFASADELRQWLARAIGENVELLYRAYHHAQLAAYISPLNGETYLLLSHLNFLDLGPQPTIEEFADQGLRVRPNSPEVLFELGRQRLVTGDWDGAMDYWKKCINEPGPHQLRIVYMLAGRDIPAQALLEVFRPDWQTLRPLWNRYRQSGHAEDLTTLVHYAAKVTERDVQRNVGIPPAYIWFWQSKFYDQVDQPEAALACLENAYDCDPSVYSVRYELGFALQKAGRYREAEPHFRWCSARRPGDKNLAAAIQEITKLRTTQREAEPYGR